MQTLVVINVEDDSVIIQTKDKNYTDTYNNFIYRDGGIEVPVNVNVLDYNEYTGHCIVNGEPSEIGVRYAKNLLNGIDIYTASKESNDRADEERRNREIFEEYDRQRAEQESEQYESMTQEEREEKIFMEYREYASDYLNETAQERLYDDIKSLKGYITSTNEKWKREAEAGIEFEDAVWARCYQILDMVKAGQIEIPTKEGFIALLPKINWGD